MKNVAYLAIVSLSLIALIAAPTSSADFADYREAVEYAVSQCLTNSQLGNVTLNGTWGELKLNCDGVRAAHSADEVLRPNLVVQVAPAEVQTYDTIVITVASYLQNRTIAIAQEDTISVEIVMPRVGKVYESGPVQINGTTPIAVEVPITWEWGRADVSVYSSRFNTTRTAAVQVELSDFALFILLRQYVNENDQERDAENAAAFGTVINAIVIIGSALIFAGLFLIGFLSHKYAVARNELSWYDDLRNKFNFALERNRVPDILDEDSHELRPRLELQRFVKQMELYRAIDEAQVESYGLLRLKKMDLEHGLAIFDRTYRNLRKAILIALKRVTRRVNEARFEEKGRHMKKIAGEIRALDIEIAKLLDAEDVI